MDDVWLWIEHGAQRTWTRAEIRGEVHTPREMIDYLRRGGIIDAYKMTLPARPRFEVRIVANAVIATLTNEVS